MGIRGVDYALLASDSRLSELRAIQTRNFTRIFSISEDMMFAGTGCTADLLELGLDLKQFKQSYYFTSEEELLIEATSSFLSRQFYLRRNFPFCSFCGLAGIKEDGNLCLLRYDALGSFESVEAFCCGWGEKLIQPMLDSLMNLVYSPRCLGRNELRCMSEAASSRQHDSKDNDMVINAGSRMIHEGSNIDIVSMTKDEAVEWVVNAFKSAASRDTVIGDGLHLWLIEMVDEDNCFQHFHITPQFESKSQSRKRILHREMFYQLSRY